MRHKNLCDKVSFHYYAKSSEISHFKDSLQNSDILICISKELKLIRKDFKYFFILCKSLGLENERYLKIM